MQELRATDDALLGVVAVDETVEVLQIAVTIAGEPVRAALRIAHRILHALQAVFRGRVRRLRGPTVVR